MGRAARDALSLCQSASVVAALLRTNRNSRSQRYHDDIILPTVSGGGWGGREELRVLIYGLH
jgi:hypothetical protein